MSPAVVAAIIAAIASILTLIGTVTTQRRGQRQTSLDVDKTLKTQGENLKTQLAEQRKQLDRTLGEQRTRTLNERFATAAGQLGGDKPPAVRLAGVYAMAVLADDWEANRQTCVDVLCGYMRLPYEPDPGDDAPAKKRLDFHGGREVRHTVIQVIAAHLRAGAAVSWQGLDFDFTGAVFDGGDFTGAEFSGGTVRFDGARFSGGTVDFDGARFSGGTVRFTGAEFSGGTVRFISAVFSGGQVRFNSARFSGGTVRFNSARFSGGTVDFISAVFSGGQVLFPGAKFPAGQVSFNGAKFPAGQVSFDGAEFSGGDVDFTTSEFSGGPVDFDGAKFRGGQVSFYLARFSGGTVSFTDARFSGATVGFHGARFSGGTVSFGGTAGFPGARFSGGTVSFFDARFSGGTVSFGGAEFSGGTVSFDGKEFFGGAEFSGGTVDFDGARFSGGTVRFDHAKFSGGQVSFTDARFSGGTVDLTRARDWSVPPAFTRIGAPPAMNTYPGAWRRSMENTPCGPSTYTRVPGVTAGTVLVKSPAALMVMVTDPPAGTSAADENENGCCVRANGERPTAIHPNCPGSNLNPSWPTGSITSVLVSPRSVSTRTTRHGCRSLLSGLRTRIHSSSKMSTPMYPS
jgi:uncharacterized protein YjbI with pentapeptide repeats